VEETKIRLSPSCRVVKTEYGGSIKPDISIDYIEHSTDPYHSDNETSVFIDRESAIEIVELLSGEFDLRPMDKLEHLVNKIGVILSNDYSLNAELIKNEIRKEKG
jgi:hypothetical protein